MKRRSLAAHERVLIAVLAINLVMFVAEFGAGVFARSTSHGVTPIAHTMLLFGSLALAANLLCVALLWPTVA